MNPTPFFKPQTLPDLKLTRAVEADSRCAPIQTLLKGDCRPLWERSTLSVPHIPFLPAMEICLRSLLARKQAERGLEHIDHLLANEQKGLSALREKQGAQPSHRVSRLLILANDGSERFYRDCERTLLRNSDRLLVLRLDEPSTRLAEVLLGSGDKPLKALLVSDRDAVSAVLFALLDSASDRTG